MLGNFGAEQNPYFILVGAVNGVKSAKGHRPGQVSQPTGTLRRFRQNTNAAGTKNEPLVNLSMPMRLDPAKRRVCLAPFRSYAPLSAMLS